MVNQHLCSLALTADATENPKEAKLIDGLMVLLSAAQKEEPLPCLKLAWAGAKVSRVSCFSERYFGIYEQLARYQVEKVGYAPGKTAEVYCKNCPDRD